LKFAKPALESVLMKPEGAAAGLGMGNASGRDGRATANTSETWFSNGVITVALSQTETCLRQDQPGIDRKRT
jgi:hypothetical protein